MEVLTQRALADQGCDNPDCTEPDCRNPPRLFFSGACHDDGLDAVYEKKTGHLTLICRECKRRVVAFLVAAGVH
jgi:hypothetical protein